MWLAAAILLVVVPHASSQQCELPPRWTINGVQPMEHTRGDVTVVALLEAS